MSMQALNLQALFRLAFEEPVAWLSGDPYTQRSINWVSISADEAQADDILVLPAEAVDTRTLERAQAKEIAALLLIGRSPAELPGEPGDLPLASLNGPTDLRSVQRSLLTLLVNQRAGWIERGLSIHDQLSHLAVEGSGLEGLARAMGELSGRGILVQDKRLRILAEYAHPALTAIWREVVDPLCSQSSLPLSLHDRKQAGQQPAVIRQELPGGLLRLIVPIRAGNVARGFLSVLGMAGEIDLLDQLVAEQGALVCAVEMARSKAIREAEKRLKGNLLTALLQEDLSARDARLWVQTMGLDLNQAHVALRFAWDGASTPSRRRLETLINGEVSRLGLKVIVSGMGGEVVCFCQTPVESGRPEAALALGQAVLDQEMDEYPGCAPRCGVSKPVRDLSEWQISFRQAGQALEMARRLGQRKPLYFPDLSVYRLLMQIEHNPELIAFQEETLGPLLAYEGGRELIHTLEVYFEHNANLSQTAEALFVHRNTLVYRMERIAEITGLNLDLPETRLAVQLALHIARMMGTLRNPPSQS